MAPIKAAAINSAAYTLAAAALAATPLAAILATLLAPPLAALRGAILVAVLVAVPGATRAEPAPAPPGLIGGPGLIPHRVDPPIGPSVGPPPIGVPVGPFWRLPPVTAAAQPGRSARQSGLPPDSAMTGPWLRCRTAIAAAEAAERIPPHLLQAIGVAESGRPVAGSTAEVPWPWTTDIDGHGAFYPDKAQAIAAVRVARAAGAHSIDVGCLQVSLLHHPHAFASLTEAFDPAANARFAAGFLRRLFAQTHGWAAAAAAYHSQTPALAGPYRAKVLAAWSQLGGPANGLAPSAADPDAAARAASPFAPITSLAMAPPRTATGFRIIRTSPTGGPVPSGRSLAAYRTRPIPIDRGG
ncbi:MAG: transglycosylase SLT domain-containing protein [Acetobacteraceae bacterium]